MFINKVFLFGNLTRDPELKTLPSGNNVVNFSLATNRTWKDASGNKQEAAEYHNVTFYGKTADIIAQYMVKGSSLFVEGRLTTRSWDHTDGTKRYKTEIVGEQFQFGPKSQSSGHSTGVYRAPDKKKPVEGNSYEDYGVSEDEPRMAKSTNPDYPSDDINPEDIPF